MPYISQEKRQDFNQEITVIAERLYQPGELNFVISSLIHKYLELHPNRMCYKNVNEVIGVLECAKLELYRMVVAPYEDKKRIENGPVSELDSKGLEDVR